MHDESVESRMQDEDRRRRGLFLVRRLSNILVDTDIDESHFGYYTMTQRGGGALRGHACMQATLKMHDKQIGPLLLSPRALLSSQRHVCMQKGINIHVALATNLGLHACTHEDNRQRSIVHEMSIDMHWRENIHI
jgi:hypothetical protein